MNTRSEIEAVIGHSFPPVIFEFVKSGQHSVGGLKCVLCQHI